MLKEKIGADGKPVLDAAGKPVMEEVQQTENEKLIEKTKTLEDKLAREAKEKVDALARAKKIEEENERLKKAKPPVPREETPINEVYNEENFPQSQEEWDELFATDMTYATDLRQAFNNRRKDAQTDAVKSAKAVQEKHPDMYLRDADSKFILDANGHVQLDVNSEKGKIWNDLVAGDPTILRVRKGAEIVMRAMEARLSDKTNTELQDKLQKDKEAEEAKRKGKVADGGVASGGTTPPAKKVEVKFNSHEEEAEADKAIARGLFKDKEDYCRYRDKNTAISGRGGF